MSAPATVLVVEDDAALAAALCETVTLGGYRALCAADGGAALELLRDEPVGAVVSDIQMAPMDGQHLLREIRRFDAELPVLLMTAFGSIPSAVAAMRDGATDYLVKPFEPEVLVSKLAQHAAARGATARDDGEMVAEDPATRRAVELARKVARTDAAVMITGASGVGKEVFFRFIHDQSARANRAPVAINCAAIPENMLEAILFGYEKGAFTGAYKSCPGKFEQADGSTLLLDEISEMSLPLQAKLLRVLQERQVERLGGHEVIDLDVRIVATSNRDLATEVAAGRFREDLYYRLNVFPLALPPLAARPADILPLARRMLRRAAARSGATAPRLSGAAEALLLRHVWPGNVRELDNVMQRASILCRDGIIEPTDLVFEGAPVTGGAEPHGATRATVPSNGCSLKERERLLILEALREGDGSRKFVAAKLGLSPRTLRYKLARLRDAGVALPD
ncbi:MAG: sigma-54-dependent Fis family transcriptional regulator [Gammaproteobacteria bacterium]|nr:sigma-54-dependent Fis family transcriptional regulator [Gammaproteobacteria bacterium]